MTSVEFRTRLNSRIVQAGLSVTVNEISQLDTYYQLLVRWSRTINLTGFQLDPIENTSLDRLFVEPLMAARLIANMQSIWFDLGSGGGSPAIPIKIARPAVSLTMIESRQRKAAFLREVTRELRFSLCAVVNERFEHVARMAEPAAAADFITIRAVRLHRSLLQLMRNFLRPDGRLLVFTNRPVRLQEIRPFTSIETFPLLPTDESWLSIVTQ